MKDLYLYLLPSLEETDVTTRTFAFATIFIMFVAYMLLLFAMCIASFFLETLILGPLVKWTSSPGVLNACLEDVLLSYPNLYWIVVPACG